MITLVNKSENLVLPPGEQKGPMSPPQHNVPSATHFLVFILEWPELMVRQHQYLKLFMWVHFRNYFEIMMKPGAVGISQEQSFSYMSPPQQNISKSQLFVVLIVFIQDTDFIIDVH